MRGSVSPGAAFYHPVRPCVGQIEGEENLIHRRRQETVGRNW